MEFEILRGKMVKEQIISRGIEDSRIIQAMSEVPRHLFVPPQYRDSAYEDHPLPIGEGQTISQPYMVGLMTQHLHLKSGEIVLEVGTGSGYQTAILAKLTKEVYSLERVPFLAAQASKILLDELKYKNIHIKTADGTSGWAEYAPYDAIMVTAAAARVPQNLLNQLKENGRLIIPLGEMFSQTLTLVQKKENDIIFSDICGCVFVPLIGEHNQQNIKI